MSIPDMAVFHGRGDVIVSVEARKGRKWITGHFAGHDEASAREMAQRKFGWSPIVRRIDTKEVLFRFGRPVKNQENAMLAGAALDRPSPQPRFTKLDAKGTELPADATGHVAVRDNASGLIWVAGDDGKRRTRAQAEKYVKSLKLLGKKDWRLPTVEELFLLADRSKRLPAIDTEFFPDCKSDWYWTSTPWAGGPAAAAWIVSFDFGGASGSNRDFGYFVRAVRAGQF